MLSEFLPPISKLTHETSYVLLFYQDIQQKLLETERGINETSSYF